MGSCIYLLLRKDDKWIPLPNWTKFPLGVPKEYLKTKLKDYHKKEKKRGKKKPGTEIQSEKSGEPELLVHSIAISGVPTSKDSLLPVCWRFWLLQQS